MFLERPRQQTVKDIKVLAWNINAVRTKLEKPVVESLLVQYDIVTLSETKTDLSISLPGFVTLRRVSSVSGHRGGTVVMVKNYLAQFITKVDYCNDDQVWFMLKCIPSVLFGFCYIPPYDSEYFSHQSFATIQEKVSGNGYNHVITGDLNYRFGTYARAIPVCSGISSGLTQKLENEKGCLKPPMKDTDPK